ncbi:MAG TPA: alpha/beta fold hydrolase, partial [Actinomycetota bacterium]|nr:alpha/beta fold hydrolase [Actinomycetota bacterium]
DVELHYKDHGNPQAPPVLGVMGFALDQRYWAAQIPAVSATHRFVTFDNRGVGRSTGDASVPLETMADDAVRLLDHLGIERTVVFGLSMGGTIAQHIVLGHPDRVSALILGVTWARPLEFMRRQDDIGRVLVEARGPEWLMEVALVRMFTPKFFEMGAEALDRMMRALNAPGAPAGPTAETLLAQIDALTKHDVLGRLGEVSCPTLVLGGKMDMMVPGFASEEIAAAIPGAELKMFESGHACMIEEMADFNARVSEFLAANLV